MCHAATCSRCGRPTWRGCGRHVEAVLGDVPESKRCHCSSGSSAGRAAGSTKRRWFTRAR